MGHGSNDLLGEKAMKVSRIRAHGRRLRQTTMLAAVVALVLMTVGVQQSFADPVLTQTITVWTSAPASAEYAATFDVAATSDSFLPVTITTSGGCSGGDTDGTATITMESGTLLCVVHYNQDGDLIYLPADEITEQTAASPVTLTVTPNSKAVTYGDAIPAYTFTVTGFVNSESEGTAAGYVAPTCSSDYTSATPVLDSPRPINCSGGSANNYSFDTTATADVTISQASSTTTVTCPASVAYTGAARTPCTVSVTGAGGSSLTPDPMYSDNTAVGTASASYTYAGDANHSGSSGGDSFDITAAVVDDDGDVSCECVVYGCGADALYGVGDGCRWVEPDSGSGVCEQHGCWDRERVVYVCG